MSYLPVKFIGYSKKEVDEYLNGMMLSHQAEISEISDNIEACRLEREALLKELELLKEKQPGHAASAKLIKLAMDRAGKLGDLMNKAAEEEADLVLKESARRIEVLESYIAETEKEIKKAKVQINAVLDYVRQYLKEGGQDDEENSLGKMIGTILPFKQKQGGLQEKEGKEARDKKEHQMEGKITADGSAMPQFKNATPPPAGKPDTQFPVNPDILLALENVAATEAAGNPVESTGDSMDSFWGEAKDDGLKFMAAGKEMEVPLTEMPLSCQTGVIPDPPDKRQDKPSPRPAPAKASPAVDKEIKTVRHKYVVGKLAGEDLTDGSGQIIIRKGEEITAETVDRAEREGMLADLIVNMVIPGLEE